MCDLLSADFLKFFLPLAGAVFAWFWNERRKRIWEEYVRKEEKYRALLEALRGFYTSTTDKTEAKRLKQSFLEQLNLCWLYCPDDVIRKAYAFLHVVHTDDTLTDQTTKKKTLGELVVAIRTDLISRDFVRSTGLKPEEFQILTTTEQAH